MSDLKPMFIGTFYSLLVRSAMSSEEGYVTVPDLSKQINILPNRGNELGKIVNQTLKEIATFEHKHNRPMLTALVCKQDKASGSFYPSDWFYVCAEQLGYDVPKTPEGKLQFWRAEFEKVHAYWSI